MSTDMTPRAEGGGTPAAALAATVEKLVARDHVPLQIPFLQELVRVPSDNPPGDCAPHATVAARLLEDLGFTVERHPVPAELVRDHGMLSVTNLIIRHRFGDGTGPTIALNAHGDVVPPGAGWKHPPYGADIVDGALYGRGAAVSKADFATYAFALRALIESGAALNGQVELHFTYDEESGGHLGPGWLLETGLTKPEYVISAGFTYTVMIAHNGSLQLDVTLTGKAAHSAWPHTGHDALHAASLVMNALYDWRDSLATQPCAIEGIDAPTLVIGTISGGVAANVVPEDVTFRLERRILPDEDPVAVETRLREIIAQAAARSPHVTCRVERCLLAEPLRPGPGQAPLVAAIQDATAEVLGERVPALGMPLFTDARLYSAAGCATVLYGAGPRILQDANGHRANEHVQLEDLRKATCVVALALSNLLVHA
ncbi:M20/M25/M40 family metallo-hydrolase [Komagataeibacter xylinus]|nr:M20/M25/M40 family metallo-hydrolase [Komagataeibacter xylinus]